MVTAHQALAGLWDAAGLDQSALPNVELIGAEPALPSSFAVGTTAQASTAASGLAAAEIHRARGGGDQQVRVDMRHAAAEFRSERYALVDGKPVPFEPADIAGLYPTGDNGFVNLFTSFPHQRAGVLAILGCVGTRAAVTARLRDWSAVAFETRAAQIGTTVAAARTYAEWDAEPQGQAAASLPPISLERIGDAPPTPLPPATERPLAGIRVLDLTRIIAGPVAGRVLAAHGAEVLNITGGHLPSLTSIVIDTGRGKRSAHLDLRQPSDNARLHGLIAGADVFVDGYRPKSIAGRGFGPEALAAARPGLIYLSLSAYGHRGPWAERRGYDGLVQTANGMSSAEGAAAGERAPRSLPCFALDHTSGQLLALGAMAGLLRRAQEGGSWLVRVSLAGTGQWIRGLGTVAGGLTANDPDREQVRDLLEESASGFGRLTAVRHAAKLERTPAYWALPSMPLGSHAAAWIGDCLTSAPMEQISGIV